MAHKSTLRALHNYLLANRNATDAVIGERIGSDDPADIADYREALKAEYPDANYDPEPEDDDEGLGESTPAPSEPQITAPSAAAVVQKAKQAIGIETPVTTHLIRHPNGQTEEIERITVKNGRAIYQVKIPADIVTLTIKGNPATVDLAKVRLLAADAIVQETGLSARDTIALGELAR